MVASESSSSNEFSAALLKQADARLTLFNILSGGLLGVTGLVLQPFQFYLKSGLHLPASEVSVCMSAMMFPWLCKPIFGLISDNIPFLGYRRRSYLILINAFATICSLLVLLKAPAAFIVSYAVLQLAMAASTVITLGLGVQFGRETGHTRKYLLLQTVCYHTGTMAAAIAGGRICESFEPTLALQLAVPIASASTLLLSVATFKLMVEKKSVAEVHQIKKTLQLTMKYAKNSQSLLTASMIFCWSVSLALSVPLYFFETNILHFKQEVIGMLSGTGSAGMLVGTVIYAFLIRNRSRRTHLTLLIALGLLSIFSYLFLSTPLTAFFIEAVRGVANMISLLVIYGLVAEICPAGAEVFVMGYLIAIRTLGMEFWTTVNGYLFTNYLQEQFSLLTIIAGAICICAGVPAFFLCKQAGTDSAAPVPKIDLERESP